MAQTIERLDKKIDGKIEKLDKKMDSKIEKLDLKIDNKFDELKKDLKWILSIAIGFTIIISTMIGIVQYLLVK